MTQVLEWFPTHQFRMFHFSYWDILCSKVIWDYQGKSENLPLNIYVNVVLNARKHEFNFTILGKEVLNEFMLYLSMHITSTIVVERPQCPWFIPLKFLMPTASFTHWILRRLTIAVQTNETLDIIPMPKHKKANHFWKKYISKIDCESIKSV